MRLTSTTISIYLCWSWRVRPTIWGVKTLILLLALPLTAAAQSNAVYVGHNRVTEALESGAVLLSGPDLKVAGGHRDTPGPLSTEQATTILYVTEGAATLVTGGRMQRLAAGDVAVIPAKAERALEDPAPSISYYVVTVPVRGLV